MHPAGSIPALSSNFSFLVYRNHIGDVTEMVSYPEIPEN